MDKEIINNFLNKRIKIFLKNGFTYICVIKQIGDDSILIIDKYDNEIAISLDEINTVKPLDELKGDSGGT